jgi:hypothetical protein
MDLAASIMRSARSRQLLFRNLNVSTGVCVPGAFLRIRKAVCNRFIERHQKTAGRLLSAQVQKSAQPLFHIVLRVQALTSHTRRQVGQLFGGVLKGVKLGVFFNLEIRSIFRRVFQSNGARHIDVGA